MLDNNIGRLIITHTHKHIITVQGETQSRVQIKQHMNVCNVNNVCDSIKGVRAQYILLQAINSIKTMN